MKDLESEPAALKVARDLVVKGRNEDGIIDLQQKKMEARDRLREARAEMRRLDAELIGKGANGVDLVLMCW